MMLRLRNRIGHAWRRLSLDGQIQTRQVWLLLPGPLLFIFALIAPYPGLFLLAYAALLLPLLSYAWVRVLGPRIALTRHTHDTWAQVGDELHEDWQLSNNAPLPLLWLEVADSSNVPGYSTRRIAASGAGQTYQWSTSAVCTKRGVYNLGPLTARTSDPFGIFEYTWRNQSTRQLVIYPPLVQLPPLVLPHGQRGGLARADLLQQHVTPSVGGLRAYTPGDPPSRIHWPTVARTNQLMVKEFDQEQAGALWIVLDLHQVGDAPSNAPTPTSAPPDAPSYGQSSQIVDTAPEFHDNPTELAIILACSLAAQALAEGRSVGLLTHDSRQRLVSPGQGPRQLWRIMSELVDAQPNRSVSLGELLQRNADQRGHQGSALAIITADLAGEWMTNLANWLRGRTSALALLIAEQAVQAQPLTLQLASQGVAAHTFELGRALPLLNPPKPRTTLRVSPLGKVVRAG